MLRSNSKAVELKVVKYLEEEVEDIEILIKDFNSHNQFDYKGHNNIIDFAVSMGTYGFTVWYSEQRALLKEWLEETEEEANKYDDDQVYNTYCNLIERVFLKHYKLTKVIKYNFRNGEKRKAYTAIQKKGDE